MAVLGREWYEVIRQISNPSEVVIRHHHGVLVDNLSAGDHTLQTTDDSSYIYTKTSKKHCLPT
jgi:hypothetical protein